MIDRSVDADKTGNGVWILDDDPTYNFFHSQFTNAKASLESFGFNVEFDTLDNWITPNTFSGSPIMGYSSWGTHAEDYNCSFNDSAYVLDSLQFQYANGAIFNTLESFNGTSLSNLTWRYVFVDPLCSGHTQGLMTQFPIVGGTGGVAHAWEPDGLVVDFRKYYTSYALGYGVVDAAYLGMPDLAWQNVVVGDPLTTIAWGKQTLIEDLNWSGTNLVTGEVNISIYKTLTIADSAVINLRHQGFITGGELIVGRNVTFNIYSWQKGLFLSYDSDYPHLVWGMHPSYGANTTYKVHRKVGTGGSWVLIATTTALEYTDTQMLLNDPVIAPNLFYKVLAYEDGQPPSDESNTVDCNGYKNRKEVAEQNEISLNQYSLRQNYPNPFNPTTQINYSIKEAGLVQLKVYDILGKEIATLVNANKEAGNYSVSFDASKLPSGVYFYQLITPGFTQARKMILTK